MIKLNVFYIILLVILNPGLSRAEKNTSENHGRTYNIVEEDAALEMQKKAKPVRPSFDTESPETIIPPSEKDYFYRLSAEYELEFDVPNVINGKVVGILQPKGYKYNPLDYFPVYPPKMVIFNPKRKEDVKFINRFFRNDLYSIFIVTGGNTSQLSNTFKRPIYSLGYLRGKISIKNTVSVVQREGGHLRVDVYNSKTERRTLK